MAQQDDKKRAGQQTAQRLKYVRKQLLKMTQDEFCQGSDMPKQTYAIWESVRFSGLSKRGAERVLARYQQLGIVCTEPWLLHGVGAPPCWQQDIDTNQTTGALQEIAQELLLFTSKQPALDFYVMDEAMMPFYEPGDTVAGYITDLQAANAKHCIVLFADDGQHQKILGRVNLDGNHITICYANRQCAARTIAIDKIASIAPVLWHRKSS